MATFVDPQGREYEVPEDPTPDELAEIKQLGLKPKQGVGMDVLKSVISGGAEGIVRAPLIAGDLAKLVGIGVNKLRPDTISDETLGRLGSQPWIDAFKGSPQDKATGEVLAHEPTTTAGRYAKAGTSAVTGAATTGGIGALPGLAARSVPTGLNAARVALTPSSVGINAAGGMAGEFGSEISGGNPLMAMLFGLGTVTAGNAGRNALFRSNFPQQMHDATKGMTKAEWEASRRSLRDFRQSGSTSYTLADLDELQPRIGGVAQGMSNSTGGDVLRYRLSPQVRRNKDIPGIMGRTMDNVSPPVDARELAETLSKQGEKTIRDKKLPLYVQRDGNLQGSVDPTRLLAATNRYVRVPRFNANNQSTGQRYSFDKAEEALLGRDSTKQPLIASVTPPVTNLKSLSQNVKALRKIPQSPTDNPGANVQRYQADKAGEAAEKALDRASRGKFSHAMTQYGQAKQNIIDPLERGLPGQIQGAKDANGLIERLRKVPVDRLQAELNTMNVTPEQARGLARTLGEHLSVIPDKTKALGTNASLDRKIFEALVDYGAPNLSRASKRNLSVADALSRLNAEHATDRTMGLHLSKNVGSTLVNPFGTAARNFALNRSAKETQKLSDLLANPTPDNLAKLREMAKIDPRAKRALEWISSLAGVGATSAQE